MKIFHKILTRCLLEVPEIPFENCDVNNFMSDNNHYLMFLTRCLFLETSF